MVLNQRGTSVWSLFSTLLWCLIVFAAACDTGDSNDTGSGSDTEADEAALDEADELACQQLSAGTARLLDASAQASEAPRIALPYSPHQIQLPQTESETFEGYLSFEPEQAGSFLLYVEPDATLEIEQGGSNSAVGAQASVSSCNGLSLFRYMATFSTDIALFSISHATADEVGFVMASMD